MDRRAQGPDYGGGLTMNAKTQAPCLMDTLIMQRNNGRLGFSRPAFLDRARLPHGAEDVARYYASQGVRIVARGDAVEWADAVCPFHQDTRPSLRVRRATGAFRCMVCGAHGGGPLDFHMQLHRLGFKEAAQGLGAWVTGGRK